MTETAPKPLPGGSKVPPIGQGTAGVTLREAADDKTWD